MTDKMNDAIEAKAFNERALHVAEVIRPNDGDDGILQVNAGWLREASDIIRSAILPPSDAPVMKAVAWSKRRVSIPKPGEPDKRIVGFVIEEGDEAWGELGISEPLFWLDRMIERASPLPAGEDGVREALLETLWASMIDGAPALTASPRSAAVEDGGRATEEQAAYGLLWRMHTTDTTIHAARRSLMAAIGRDGQRAGIDWARSVFGPHKEPNIGDLP